MNEFRNRILEVRDAGDVLNNDHKEIRFDPDTERVVSVNVHATTRFGFEGCLASCTLEADGVPIADFALIETAKDFGLHALRFKEPLAVKTLRLRARHKKAAPYSGQYYSIIFTAEFKRSV